MMMLLTMSPKDHIALIWIKRLWIKSIVVKGNILAELNRPDQGIWEPLLYFTKASFVIVIVIANILFYI